MSNPKLKATLNQVLCRVLEQAVFVFPEPLETLQEIDPYSTDFIQVSLSFSGSQSGRVAMLLPISLCKEFCTNMLGEAPSEETSLESQVDSAKEIANMVTGQVLTELYGTEEVFDLTPPEVSSLEPEFFFEILDASEYTCIKVDESPVIAIYIEQEKNEHKSLNC